MHANLNNIDIHFASSPGDVSNVQTLHTRTHKGTRARDVTAIEGNGGAQSPRPTPPPLRLPHVGAKPRARRGPSCHV